MLTEKERERLSKICPVELDLKVFLALVQVARGVGEDVYNYEDTIGKKCHWCKASTVETSSIAYDDLPHEKYCPIRLSREQLYNLGLQLNKGRLIILAEIQSGGKFLQAWDEEVYYVGDIDEKATAEDIIDELVKRRYAHKIDVTYTIKFTSLEHITEYKF